MNLRSGPGKSYKVLTTLAAGTNALAKGRDASGTWVFVGVGEQDGWVNVSFLRLLSGAVSTLPVTDTVVTAAAGENAPAGGVPVPVAGGSGLKGFGYGGHVDSFAYPDLMHYAGMTWAKRQVRFRMGMSGGVAAGAINQAHASGFKILLGIVGFPQDMGAPAIMTITPVSWARLAALGAGRDRSLERAEH